MWNTLINSKINRMLKKIIRIYQIACFFLLGSPLGLVAQSLEIWQLQGSGATSPYLFQSVNTSANVVTAVGNGFFFLQTPTERSDNNELTSDGILVSTEGPQGLSVGNVVNVFGVVREVDGMTTLVAEGVQTLLPSGPLPMPVPFDADYPSTLPGPVNSLERTEGMRVSISEAMVCGPSDFYEEAALSATGALPVRGVGLLYPGQSGLPVWDGNPEIFWIDPDALNAPNNRFLSVGMRVSATGVLMQLYDRYTLWPYQYTVTGNLDLRPARPVVAGEFSLASFNALQLRTDEDDYAQHVQKVARYVVEALRTPDVVALQEIGSLVALQELSYQIGLLVPGLNYGSYFITGNDDINVAYLIGPRMRNIRISQLGNDEFLSLGGRLHDRPPLLLEADLPTNPPTPISVLNLHLRSLLGIEGSNANFVRTKRHEQAVSVAQMVQARQSENLFIVGDFNAYPFTDGYVDVLSQITGRSSLGALVPTVPVVSPVLIDYAQSLPAAEQYSYIFNASTQQIDHCLSTQLSNLEVSEFRFVRGNAGAALAYSPNTQIVSRSSDHDGFVVYLQPEFPVASQEVAVAASLRLSPNPFARAGGTLFFEAPDEPAQLALLDLTGRVVAQAWIPAGQGHWQPTVALAPGMYWVRLSYGKARRYARLVVE